jgi:salicylate hydroxylase
MEGKQYYLLAISGALTYLSKNGNVIGATPLRPAVEEAYGYPYWLIHRADFHKILHERAMEVGVIFQVNSHVTSVDASVPIVILKDGRTLQADVIIGADGMFCQGCLRPAY